MSTQETTQITLDQDGVFLTERQLADRWQVSVKKLQADRWKKVGPAYLKLGSTVRYRLAEVREYELQQIRKMG